MLNWIKRILGLGGTNKRSTYRPPNTQSPSPDSAPTMNEGDYHSGPAGYSPNTAYPETQYGSGFDEEAEWNEGDWR